MWGREAEPGTSSPQVQTTWPLGSSGSQRAAGWGFGSHRSQLHHPVSFFVSLHLFLSPNPEVLEGKPTQLARVAESGGGKLPMLWLDLFFFF